jgi:hypothetical protein
VQPAPTLKQFPKVLAIPPTLQGRFAPLVHWYHRVRMLSVALGSLTAGDWRHVQKGKLLFTGIIVFGCYLLCSALVYCL